MLPSTETEAYVPGAADEEPHFYAVTSIINGTPTLDRPVISASAGDHSQYPRVTFDTSKVNCGTQSGSLGILVEDPNTIMNSVVLSGLAKGMVTIPLSHGIGLAKVSQSLSPADFSSAGANITAQATDALGTGPAVSTAGLCAQNTVLSFGDSVSAGYGLGGSQGYPDNPHAYSALLASKLGLTSQTTLTRANAHQRQRSAKSSRARPSAEGPIRSKHRSRGCRRG